jgi:hypothetical protein
MRRQKETKGRPKLYQRPEIPAGLCCRERNGDGIRIAEKIEYIFAVTSYMTKKHSKWILCTVPSAALLF